MRIEKKSSGETSLMQIFYKTTKPIFYNLYNQFYFTLSRED
jgi:hypothetical protein